MSNKNDEWEYGNYRGKKKPRRNELTPNLGKKESKKINELKLLKEAETKKANEEGK